MTRRDPFVFLPGESPLLDFYRGTFDVAYIAVHPFFRIPELDPLRCRHGTQSFQRSEMPEEFDMLAYLAQDAAERAISHPIAPDEVDERAKRSGTITTWRDMLDRCSLDDARAMSRALRTTIGGLRAEFADQAGADDLVAACRRAEIFQPTDSEFQPCMERSIATAFARAGCERVVLGDEFGEHDVPVDPDTLRGDATWVSRPDWPEEYAVRRIYAEDRSMIAIVPWDEFFTVVAMTAECAARVRIDDLLEGFWCDETTDLSWFRGAPVSLIGPL